MGKEVGRGKVEIAEGEKLGRWEKKSEGGKTEGERLRPTFHTLFYRF